MQISPIPSLRTPRLILREVREHDAPQIFDLRSDPEVNALVKRPRCESEDDAIAFIERIERDNRDLQMIYWGITTPETNHVIGSICLWKFSDDRGTAEVGYDLSVGAQRKGYMTEAMKAVLGFGFHRIGLHTVEAYTQRNNVASTRLLKKFGFELLSDRNDASNELNAAFALTASRCSAQDILRVG